VHIGGGFDRLHNTQNSALRKAVTDVVHLYKNNVPQGFLSVNSDTHPSEITLGANPCMFFVVFGHGHMPA
jgi:hypothetical protein